VKISSGSIALPLCLIAGGVLAALKSFGIVHIGNIWNFWPVILIASGMEELYLWMIE
jgi:hypothetical protein